jgi:uncharacterized protein YndB with AHSA1/START domain
MNRSDFEPGPPADVTYQADDRWTLVFVRELRHPPEKVWSALTEPDQLRQWSPFTADRNLADSGEAVLTMIDGDESVDLPGMVHRVEPPRFLEYSWDTDMLRWELEPTSTGTRLTLRHTVEDLDQMPGVTAGWHICLDVAERLLDGNPVGPIVGHDALNYDWQDLHDVYAEKLGITPGG